MMEKFAREKLPKHLKKTGLTNSDFYGNFYANNVEDFEIVPGHRSLLKRMISHCSNNKPPAKLNSCTPSPKRKPVQAKVVHDSEKSVESGIDLNKLEKQLILKIRNNRGNNVLKTVDQAKVKLSVKAKDKLQNIVAPVCVSTSERFDYEAKVACIWCTTPLLAFHSLRNWII